MKIHPAAIIPATGIPSNAPPVKVLAISGMRDITPAGAETVTRTMRRALSVLHPTIVNFGGARGVDTIALKAIASSSVTLIVYLPATRQDAPTEAYLSLPLADRVIELKGDPSRPKTYLDRNSKMLENANALLAFTDGQRKGGTWDAIKKTWKAGIPVYVVHIERSRT